MVIGVLKRSYLFSRQVRVLPNTMVKRVEICTSPRNHPQVGKSSYLSLVVHIHLFDKKNRCFDFKKQFQMPLSLFNNYTCFFPS